MAEPSRLSQALEYLGGLDAAVAPKLRAVSDAIDPVSVARRAGLNLPTGEQVGMAAHFVGPGADIEGMVNDAREGNAAFGRGDLMGAFGGYGSAAAAIPMMFMPGTVAGVKKGVNAATDAVKALPMDDASRIARANGMDFDTSRPVYHSTDKNFRSFDPNRAVGTQFWSTTDKAAVEAGEVGAAGRGVVKEMYHRIKNPAGWAEYDKYGIDELIGRGYDGVALPDGNGHTTYIAFKPNQYRDVKAKFDPAKKESSNLLASMLAAGVFGGAAYGQGGE